MIYNEDYNLIPKENTQKIRICRPAEENALLSGNLKWHVFAYAKKVTL